MGKKSRRERGGGSKASGLASDNNDDPPPFHGEEMASNNNGGRGKSDAAGAKYTHREVEAMVSPPGILDLFQARDWPHRTGDPIGDPALFTP